MSLKSKFITSLEDLPQNIAVSLYGAGEGGRFVQRYLAMNRKDITLTCCLDDYRTGFVLGLPIVAPNEYAPHLGLILITSAYWPMINEKLSARGIANYRIVHPSVFYANQFFSKDEYLDRTNDRKQVEALFDNDADRELYRMASEIRRHEQWDVASHYDFLRDHCGTAYQQYVECIHTQSISTMIEGGVLDGSDTVRFYNLMGADLLLYGFEPFFEAYTSSCHFPLLNKISNLFINPMALWSSCCRLSFETNRENPDSSKIASLHHADSDETILTDAITIDAFIEKSRIKKIDFIKLDIEGSELEALRGAANTLKQHRPQLAVCIYHSTNDLIDVPLFLGQTLVNYHYRLRHYSASIWDSVLYAIPNELILEGINADSERF